ncbi:CTLH/CRA C-terminal to lish motif domain-containing protein [Sphaerosporella brunnea]|uniref:CTLH/CRA C-terminal to lish motif domain-containing protein n=1 Tax=Sphaerosporella brunnea TaxID=1250544 RepID=A0A5J5FD70_9PEZI|nr:CTLH/CRA C-terminal to lish motif domain-containing protein [Sphaerosporella brunnea]
MSASTSKLDADAHLLLDKPLLRLPHELLRKTFKQSQKAFEREQSHVLSTLNSLCNSPDISSEDALHSLDSLISRMQGFKRKVDALREEERTLHGHERKRIAHLQGIFEVGSLVEEGYERWSRVRLDRLMVDFLVRGGYEETATALAKEKGIEELVDVGVFSGCMRIEKSLRNRNTQEALAWCLENKAALRKMKSTLEFELRLQQYVELVRAKRHKDAMAHSKRFLAPHAETHFADIQKAAGLLAMVPETSVGRYKELYSPSRWEYLADTFVNTHHTLYGLPQRPLIHIALSAGMSSLKTPSCHSAVASSSSNTASMANSLCPICSKELNELAKNVPYAHHARSSVEPDPVMMPNGRIYGRERLEVLARKLGLPKGMVRDPTTGEDVEEKRLRKVYIM